MDLLADVLGFQVVRGVVLARKVDHVVSVPAADLVGVAVLALVLRAGVDRVVPGGRLYVVRPDMAQASLRPALGSGEDWCSRSPRPPIRKDAALQVVVKPSSEPFELHAVAPNYSCDSPANGSISAVGTVGFEPTL